MIKPTAKIKNLSGGLLMAFEAESRNIITDSMAIGKP